MAPNCSTHEFFGRTVNGIRQCKFDIMKKSSVFPLTLFGLFLNINTDVSAQDLEVIIKNVKTDQGVLMVGLFNSEKTFPKKAWKGERLVAKVGEGKVVFRNIPPGDYAISVFHDEDNDGKLDTNFMGTPKEGFGFSNDAMGMFGPPSFEKAKIIIPATKSTSLTLKYL